MAFGTGRYTYELAKDWGQLPAGWKWGWIPALACDSHDRIYVYSRSEHPLVIFDRQGNFVGTFGDGVLKSEGAHGLYIDADDNVYCVDYALHCVYKFNRQGKLVMTLGTPGQPAAKDGDPFNKPTGVAVASTSELFVSDGYGNRRVHKYSPDGQLLLSWGRQGTGPGEFALSHGVAVDKHDRVWVCDRDNDRLQIFDTNGRYLTEMRGLLRPDTVCFDPQDNVVYVAELTQQVSIYTLEGRLITKWGSGRKSDKPGEFLACPHGICVDSHGDLYVGEVQADGRLQKYIRKESK